MSQQFMVSFSIAEVFVLEGLLSMPQKKTIPDVPVIAQVCETCEEAEFMGDLTYPFNILCKPNLCI